MCRWDAFRGVVLGIAVAVAMPASAFASVDPLTPTAPADAQAASPLRQVTIATGDIGASVRFYESALGMERESNAVSNSGGLKRLRVVGIAAPFIFKRAGVSDAARIQLIGIAEDRPVLRPKHNALALGGLALGMPLSGQARREEIVKMAGFSSAAGVTSMTLPRGDGSTYNVQEIHYRGPDGVLVLGIDRGDMVPVGPIDAGSGIGGPAYASLVVENLPATEVFLKDVMRYEKRRDAVFTSAGPKGGLGLDTGQRFAFQQWFAPGSRTGYLVIMKMLDRPASLRKPTDFTRRGIMMWSFDVMDVGAMVGRVGKIGARIVAKPSKDAPSLIVAMPDGFLVEFVKREEKAE